MSIDLDKHTEELTRTSVDIENDNDDRIEDKTGMFSHVFSFSGRIRRLEFGLSFLIYAILGIFVNVELEEMPLLGLLYIPLLWFWWAQLCKRFHDRNLSGMHILTLFIPLYNLYVLCMQFFADGDEYENDYGADPKGRNIYS